MTATFEVNQSTKEEEPAETSTFDRFGLPDVGSVRR